MNFSDCRDDSSFGPAVHGCRRNFDFTVKFESIFFSLIPASIFIAIALLRTLFLVRRPQIISGAILRGAKLVTAVVYGGLQLGLLTLSPASVKSMSFSVPSMAIAFLSALCVILVSSLEHSRAPRPSILLNVYFFLTIIFDIVHARTLWLVSVTVHEFTISRIFTATVVLKALLLLLESRQKSKWIQWDVKKHSPEETSGIFGLATFSWLNKVFLEGYRKIMTLDDLYPLDQSMATAGLQLRLMEQLQSSTHTGQRYHLAKAMAKALTIPLLFPIAPRFALIAFRFCQPFLINTLLEYLQQPVEGSSKDIGNSLIIATVLIYTGLAVSTALYRYLQERAICMSRGMLAGVVYSKTTEAKLSAGGDSAALTLMSIDVERIRLGLTDLHELWANSIEVALASWLLHRQIGTAVSAPLIVILFCLICGAFVNRFTGERQKSWMDKIEKRVGLTADVISSMKNLKISGLTAPVEDLIQNMRVEELKSASSFRTIFILVVILGYAPLAISPIITFAVTSRTLDTTTIFTSLSYLILLADPLGYLFQNAPNLLAAFACLDRIQVFLEKDERIDFRKSNEDKGDGSGSMVNIVKGHFGWTIEKPSLNDINLSIPKSRLTIVVGPVASGKSTLCKVLLGEVPVSQAQVTMHSSFTSRRVGYCDQTPYLANATIRENIIGFSCFDLLRYTEVIQATMLEPDLCVLPQGDKTRIGSNGIILSGGQRQRVSMARALYLDSNFFIFDDVLSGLDADTEKQVFRQVFGPDGLLRRWDVTVVLCTHNVRHLSQADHIVALGVNGNVVEQGSMEDLIADPKYVHSLGVKIQKTMPAGVVTSLATERVTKSGSNEISATNILAPSYIDPENRMMGDSTVYRYYLASLGNRSIVAFVVFGLGWGFFYNWGNIWLKYWSEDLGSGHPSRSNSFYIGLYAVFQITYLASLFFCYLICYRTMIQISGAKLHKAALSTVINAPLRFFATTDTGLITNLFSQDMNLIDDELPIAVTNLAVDICNALGMAAVIASSSPFLAIAYPFIFLTLFGIQKVYLRTSRQLRLLDLESRSPLYTHFLDTIRGIVTFRAFGWIPTAIDINNRLLDDSQRATYLLALIQRWLGFVLQLVVAILAVAVVVLATQLRSSTALTGASLITLMTFGDILNYIIRWFTQMETSIGAVSRVKNFSEKVKSENLEGEDMTPSKEWPLRGSIHINGISASYGDTKECDVESTYSIESPRHVALKNLTLSIQPGEKVAICGRSGSGKSSIILLLLRLLNPHPSCSGSILVDDTHLHKIDRSTLRERLIAIPQDPVFLPDGSSFMSNLDPSLISTEHECRAVLEAVGLWTLVDQRGGLWHGFSADTLSQGQRQLFNLARAIVRCRVRKRHNDLTFGTTGSEKSCGGILLLDEISSSMDRETDRAMQRVIREEFKGYTIIMVCHRLEIVMDFDTVVVMDEGSVVETGSPMLLVDRDGSRFQQLWSIDNRTEI